MAPFGLAVAVSALWGGFGPGLTAAIFPLFVRSAPRRAGSAVHVRVSRAGVRVGGARHRLGGVRVVTRRVQRLTALAKARCSEAERGALQADRLAQLIAALSQARTSAGVIDAAVQEPLHALGGDAGLLLLVGPEGAATEMARAVGYQDDERELREASVAKMRSPVADSIACGAPIVLQSRERVRASVRR